MQIEIEALLETLQQFEQSYNQAQNKEDLEDIIRQLLTFTFCLLEEIEKQQDFWNQLQQGIQNEQRKNTAYVESAFEEVDSYREQYLSQLETCRILEEKLNQQDYTNKLLQDALANELQQSNLNISNLQQQYSQYLEQLKEQLEQKDFYISQLSQQLQAIQKEQNEQEGQEGDIQQEKENKQMLISVRDINIQQSLNEIPDITTNQSDNNNDNNNNNNNNNNQYFKPTSHLQVSIQELQNSKSDLNSQSRPTSSSKMLPRQLNENYFQFGRQEEQQRNLKQTMFHIEYTSPFIKSQFASKLHSRINSLAIFEQNNNNAQIKNILTQSDPYFQFFQLISQCVKLDSKNNKFYSISVQHLYQTFIDQKIPFNKWYRKIYEYLIKN